jgi:hypothetical protein
VNGAQVAARAGGQKLRRLFKNYAKAYIIYNYSYYI